SRIFTHGNNSGLFVGGDHNGASTSGSGHAIFSNGGQGQFSYNLRVYEHGTLEIDRGFVSVAADGNGSERKFHPDSNLIIHLYADDADADSWITIGAPLELDDPILTLELEDGFDAPLGTQFNILQYTSTLTGTFKNLAEGATLTTSGGEQFIISYNLGENNN